MEANEAMDKQDELAAIICVARIGVELPEGAAVEPSEDDLRIAAAVRSFMGLDEADALRVIHSAVSEYLPPDGIEAKACISKILAVLDRPAIANTLGKHADGRA